MCRVDIDWFGKDEGGEARKKGRKKQAEEKSCCRCYLWLSLKQHIDEVGNTTYSCMWSIAWFNNCGCYCA